MTIFPHCFWVGTVRAARPFGGPRSMAFSNKIVYGDKAHKNLGDIERFIPSRNVLERPQADMTLKANLLFPPYGLTNGGSREGL